MRMALALCLAASTPALAAGVFEKNHPLVEEGMAAAAKGDFEGALEKYDAAAKQLPPRAQLEFDRAHAYFKLGRLDEAKAALEKAQSLDPKGALANNIQYNLGKVLSEKKDTQGAIAAYRKALRAKPDDAQARHNLELLLGQVPPPPPPGPDGGTDGGQDSGTGDAGKPDAGKPDGGKPDGGHDGGADGGGHDGGSGDAGNGDAGSPSPNPGKGDAGADGGAGDGGSGQGSPGKSQDAGSGESGGNSERSDAGSTGKDGGVSNDTRSAKGIQDGGSNMPKSEAERLLDAMRNSEKNLQLWRFQQGKTKRAPHAKDW